MLSKYFPCVTNFWTKQTHQRKCKETNYALAADNSIFWQWGVRNASSDCGIFFFTAALSATMVNSRKANSSDLKWIILSSTTGHMRKTVPPFQKQALPPTRRYRQVSFCWFFPGSFCKVSISKDLKKHQLNFQLMTSSWWDQVKTIHIRLLARQFY